MFGFALHSDQAKHIFDWMRPKPIEGNTVSRISQNLIKEK
jgi:hypothetical protein